ncbi:aldose 1-epimerase family protein [Microbispora sp. ZYX-F-249]|uniref:Aldose 1-epimerase family protein n=1 Tax=Microbispora maris TaxID=3144104 RepID=A0ABV0AGY2_9ACTN
MTEPAVRGPVPPTGTQHTIAAHGYEATVTEVGGGLRALTYRERPLVMSYPATAQPVGGAGQLLLPWPNRVRDGRYDADGETRQLAINEPRTGNAAHGFARLMPWRVLERDDASIRLGLRLFPQPGYPHVLDLTASYALGEAGLKVEVSAVNVGDGVAPYGMGAHPYLTLGEETVDDAVLEVPAAEWTPVDEQKIPVGRRPVEGTEYDFREGRRIGGTVLDTPYTALRRDADGLVRARLRAADGSRGVELWGGTGVEWLQVFTGDTLAEPYRRAGVAVEPMSCPPNAFATGECLVRLAPGERVAHRWGIAALPAA